jgi:hypothetical protein
MHVRSAVVIALVVSSVAACGGSRSPAAPAANGPALTERVDTAHYTFQHAPGDTVESARQEAFHAWFTRLIAVTVPRRIEFFKYRDRDHMMALTGRAANGWAEPDAFAVHSIWTWNAHEAIHIYTALVGRPSDFFNEGIAVGLSADPFRSNYEPLWQSMSVDAAAKQALGLGGVPSVTAIMETDPFRRLADTQSYPIAGSFVKFLVDRYGIDPMMAFFRPASRTETLPSMEHRFVGLYGMALADAERLWREHVQNR